MDSLTQIVLGAAVGEAVLGKKVGNKAMLYGAIAGTIPDLDVLARQFTDTTMALEMHRGFTHSVVFSLLFAPLFGWLVTRYERHRDFKDWSWLFFWAFFTHPILDAHTTWGTQLFWPLDLRLAFQTIFVIDPVYTVPFLMCLILALVQKRSNPKRQFYNKLGLWISSGYLALTFLLKGLAYMQFMNVLESQDIAYKEMDTRPSPMNTILWSANVDTEENYLLGNYSFFDSQPIQFDAYPKNHQWIDSIHDDERVQRMIHISQGWYTITREDEYIYFNDLRFGLLSLDQHSRDFVFKYKIGKGENGEITFTEVPKNNRDGLKLISALWTRIKGN
ncbi:MAG: metal-dependent hydrolase [Salibacteraceae bacterium]